jgi:hypothetical protein
MERKRPDAIRLGFGEVTPPEGRLAMLRVVFFHHLDHLVPACREDLAAIFEGWKGRDLHPNVILMPWAKELPTLQAWAVRWHLVGKGGPVDWVIETAALTLNHWNWRGSAGDWAYPGWGSVLPDREDRQLCGGRYYHDPSQSSEERGKLKDRRGERFRTEYESLRSKYLAAGFKRTSTLQEPGAMDLLIRHQVLGERSDALPSVVKRLKADLGFYRAKGRPRRKPTE